MKLVPFGRLKVVSSNELNETINEIKSLMLVESEQFNSFSGEQLYKIPFDGLVIKKRFLIWQRTHKIYNSFKPIFHGKIKETDDGIEIKLFGRLSILTSVVMFFYFAFFLFLIILDLNNDENKSLFNYLMLLGGYIVMMMGFNYSFDYMKIKLYEMFKSS